MRPPPSSRVRCKRGEGPPKRAPTYGESRSRSEVQPRARRANRQGDIEKGEGSAPVTEDARTTKSRSQVNAEAEAAVKAGKVGKGADVKVPAKN